MSRFNAIAMASEVACHPQITTQRTLLGFRTKATYTPTNSDVHSYANYYDVASGEYLSRLITMSSDDILDAISTYNNIQFSLGNAYRFDICLSDDYQFLALRMYRSSSKSYCPCTDVMFFTGNEAEQIEHALLV